MWLTVLVDEIAIALGVPIILMAADNCSGDAAQDCACNRSGRRADSRKDRASKSAGASTDCRTGNGRSHRVIVGRSGRAATERKTADGSCRD